MRYLAAIIGAGFFCLTELSLPGAAAQPPSEKPVPPAAADTDASVQYLEGTVTKVKEAAKEQAKEADDKDKLAQDAYQRVPGRPGCVASSGDRPAQSVLGADGATSQGLPGRGECDNSGNR